LNSKVLPKNITPYECTCQLPEEDVHRSRSEERAKRKTLTVCRTENEIFNRDKTSKKDDRERERP